MGLQVYRNKRKFAATPEPRGRTVRSKGNQFVIQKHAARRLHYDLRLELEGVMKSWAVTRGPSLVAGEKRLAVQVEDHPIEYNKFEGTIPQGQYGGGTVMIWDRGLWSAEGDPHNGLKKGHLSFTLDGEKMHGAWHLIRMRGRPHESKENWLLIKARDEAARSAKEPDILEQQPLSVVSGRSIPEIAEGKGRARVWQSNRGTKQNVTAGATRGNGAATPQPKSGRGSPRAAATRSKKDKEFKDKKTKDPDAPLPDFVPPSLATLRALAPNEPGWMHEVKFDGYRIQARLDRGKVRLLTRKGLDWCRKFPNVAAAVSELPAAFALIDGEVIVEDENGISNFSALQAALKAGDRQRFVYYVFDLLHLDGRDFTSLPLIERKAALKRVLAAAKATGPIRYSEHFEDEGSLVLPHACKMTLEGIVSKRKAAPYRSGRSDTFLKVKCSNAQEFVVGGYTPSSVLPPAAEVVREAPAMTKQRTSQRGTEPTKIAAKRSKVMVKRSKPGSKPGRQNAKFVGARTTPWKEGDIRFTHPDRVYWVDVGVTKQDLADFYRATWDWMAPHVVARPLALVRCPEGTKGQCFFQKHASAGLTEQNLRTVIDGNGRQIIAIETVEGLLSLVQAGVLELHARGSMIDRLEQCNRIVFDLDPGDDIGWSDIVAAAHDVRDRLDAVGLTSFVKLSGGKGLHVVVPIEGADWNTTKIFVQTFAQAMVADDPGRYVAKMTKLLRKGKIFVDYLRNSLEQTSVAAYSTRARAGAPVSVPVTWQELGRTTGGNQYTVLNLMKRLHALKQDPWADIGRVKQKLP